MRNGKTIELHPSFEMEMGAASRCLTGVRHAVHVESTAKRDEITGEQLMEDWVYVLIDCVLAAVLLAFGFVVGYVFGHRHGWSLSTSYYNGYQHENTEIIGRLRGRIIWLEASIKEARERLERVENEP